jgi:hypothetical protein
MQNNDFIPNVFRNVDKNDSRAFVEAMTEDGAFRFANNPAVEGRENIFQFLEGFFGSIKGLKHTNLEYWYQDDNWFVTGDVTYIRHDESTLEAKFANVFKMKGDLIDQYLVYVDASELYK